MYIRKIEINNIRAIRQLTIEFEEGKEAGWHVILGDNGTGKSSVIRAVALGLVGMNQVMGLRPNWNDWRSQNAEEGSISLDVFQDSSIDTDILTGFESEETFITTNKVVFDKKTPNAVEFVYQNSSLLHPRKGYFSAAYGPFRRFEGGNTEWKEVFKNLPRLAAHLSCFNEGVALSESLEWLRELDYLQLKEKESSQEFSYKSKLLAVIINFINSSKLLPHGATLLKITADGLLFKDGNGNEIGALQLSDGYRSILSLLLEFVRQMDVSYGSEVLYKDIEKNNFKNISLPGVVLIDEVDAHLHPTWQTRIGEWFLEYFPNIQFIVTTHSPLICRACERGTIWKLAAPGHQEENREITGDEKNRLIFGNILDAYETAIFGERVSRSEKARAELIELAGLNKLHKYGELKAESDIQRRQELLKKYLSDDTFNF